MEEPCESRASGRSSTYRHARADADAPSAEVVVQDLSLKNPEDLREATRGADLNIVQLAPGVFGGRLTHVRLGDIALSAGDFGPDIRARGVMNPQLLTIGTMLESTGEVSQWDYDVRPGDVVVFPKSVEQEGRYTGRSRYVTVTLAEEQLTAFAGGEGEFQEPKFWSGICPRRPSSVRRARMCRALDRYIEQLRRCELPNTAAGMDFLKRSIIETILSGVFDEASRGSDDRRYRSARLVRNVEDYFDALADDRPVHISELCSTLRVSRRALHRAFHEMVGMGPMAFLRLRRLAAVRRALKGDRLPRGGVTQVALEYGFGDLGRFAGYYRRIFQESPSETWKAAGDVRC